MRIPLPRARVVSDARMRADALRAHPVNQQEGWAAADAQVANANAATQHHVADLPVFAPCLRVVVRRFVGSATGSRGVDSARRKAESPRRRPQLRPFFAGPTRGRD
jgi:hypothetical protein